MKNVIGLVIKCLESYTVIQDSNFSPTINKCFNLYQELLSRLHYLKFRALIIYIYHFKLS